MSTYGIDTPIPGQSTLATYVPKEIHGPGHDKKAIEVPITICKGQNIAAAGTVVGYEASSKLVKVYNKSGAAASASVPAAGATNTGGGTISSVTVSDTYTKTDSWTLTCITASAGAGTFRVESENYGIVDDATVGVAYSYPSTNPEIQFTLSDGSPDFAVGDTFTFTTTGKAATVAAGILPYPVDATNGNVPGMMETAGVYKTSQLTGLDDEARLALLAKDVGIYTHIA